MKAISMASGPKTTKRTWPVLCGILSVCVAGCSSSDDKTADRPQRTAVSGQVMFQGNLVAGASVILSPVGSGGKAASGVTDESGKYSLTTYESGDGAIPGEYQVMVLKVKAEQNTAPSEESADYKGPPVVSIKTPGPEHLIPAKYGNIATSGLRATVPAEGKLTDLNFQLSL